MDRVIRRFERHSALSEKQQNALRATFSTVRSYAAGEDVLEEGDEPAFVGALISGLLCRFKSLSSGERQIIGLLIPGDIFDLHSFGVASMDHSVRALSLCRVAIAPHAAVEDLADELPNLDMLLWRDAVVEASISREWTVNCGRRSARARISHLLCEHYVRMEQAGLVSRSGCDLPLTQIDLADAAGLSVVHVNRVVQRLRAQGLIVLRSGRLRVLDWDELVAAAGFDSSYLNARESPRGSRSSAFRPTPGRRSRGSGSAGAA